MKFDFFTRRTAKDYIKNAEDRYIMPASKEILSKEHYRVGFDDQGKTTLTFISDNGVTMTLTMNQEACEQLIRMLRATYPTTEAKETTK